MKQQQALHFTVEGPRVTTVGLTTINHPELTMDTKKPDQIEDTRAVLLHLAAYILGTDTRLNPGDVLDLDCRPMRVEPREHGTLEVVEQR